MAQHMARPQVAERQTVRVCTPMPPGHGRPPAYFPGKTGTVERVLGPFPNPEDLAYRHKSAPLPLYRVRFRMGDVWPDPEDPNDTIEAEIYAHWLTEVPNHAP